MSEFGKLAFLLILSAQPISALALHGQSQSKPAAAVTVIIKPGDLLQGLPPKPFVVGDLFSLELWLTNISSSEIDLSTLKVLFQDRPELKKDGHRVVGPQCVATNSQAS